MFRIPNTDLCISKTPTKAELSRLSTKDLLNLISRKQRKGLKDILVDYLLTLKEV